MKENVGCSSYPWKLRNDHNWKVVWPWAIFPGDGCQKEALVHLKRILRTGKLVILSRCLHCMSLATPQALHPVNSMLLRACRQAQCMLSLCWGCLRSQSSLHTPVGSRSCFLFHLAEKSVFIYREVERVAHGINPGFFCCFFLWATRGGMLELTKS